MFDFLLNSNVFILTWSVWWLTWSVWWLAWSVWWLAYEIDFQTFNFRQEQETVFFTKIQTQWGGGGGCQPPHPTSW
jgi:hypothetical protein